MKPPVFSTYNTAHSVLFALQHAEALLMPPGSHSRLCAAVEAAEAAVSFIGWDSAENRANLVERLERLKDVDRAGRQLQNLHPDSLISHGIDLALHIAQAALAREDLFAEHALRESQLILRMAHEEVPA